VAPRPLGELKSGFWRRGKGNWTGASTVAIAVRTVNLPESQRSESTGGADDWHIALETEEKKRASLTS